MKMLVRIGMMSAVALGMLTASSYLRADDRSQDLKRIHDAQEVFHELMETPDRAIPHELLESAKCIAIIPGQKKVGFIVAAEYGKGLAMCRSKHDWSGPVFLTITGGGFGLLIGGASTDLVMVFRNREGFQKLLSDKFKIGADATAAAGPVGRSVAAATDLEMHAEIVTYSRSRGVFAGVSLEGAVVTPDRKADEALYGSGVDRETVINGKVAVPESARDLVAEIRRYTEGQKSARKSSDE
jgi:lipid-binding SYLF domain-containing protein